MNATRRPVLGLATDQYVCGRCGILRRYNPSRKKPALCSDCQTVLRYLDKPERIPYSPDHCRRGHPWTAESTYIKANGRRECRICRSKTFCRQHGALRTECGCAR